MGLCLFGLTLWRGYSFFSNQQDQSEVFFKIKRSTQLKKLMEAYCDRQGKTLSSVRFLYDGERVQTTNTPNEVMHKIFSLDAMLLFAILTRSILCRSLFF
jgi:hypothetical protein